MEKINYGYFRLARELPLLVRASVIKPKKSSPSCGNVLVVDTSLIGDFIASLPALRTFIKRQRGNVDLIVAPHVFSLAKKIRGVRKVFIANSVFFRKLDRKKIHTEDFDDYDTVLIMRLSNESLRFVHGISKRQVKTSLGPYLKYGFYLARKILAKAELKQWSDVNFEILGEKVKKVPFEQIFCFEPSDLKKIENLPQMRTESLKVIIHTGSGWPVKLWDNSKWIALLKRLNSIGDFRFIFIGGKDEKKDFLHIQRKLGFKVFSLIGKVDLKDLMLVMRQSDYFIGIDSGPRNMAHLADLRSVSLLGPGPKFFMPTDKRDILVDKSDCRCNNLFCYKPVTCLQRITVGDVYKAFVTLSKQSAGLGKHTRNI